MRSREHRPMNSQNAPAFPGPPAFTATRRGRETQGQWLMVSGGLLLGTLGIFIEEAGQPALTAVWFRCAFGLLALTLWFALSRRCGELRLSRCDAALAISGGLFMVLSWTLFFGAVPRTSMSVATLVVHVQPFLIMVAGTLWLGEHVSRRQWGAALVALLGLGLATGGLDHAFGHQSANARYLQGLALALGAALAYAVAPLLLRRATGASALVMAWWQCVAGTVALLWWPLTQGWPAHGRAAVRVPGQRRGFRRPRLRPHDQRQPAGRWCAPAHGSAGGRARKSPGLRRRETPPSVGAPAGIQSLHVPPTHIHPARVSGMSAAPGRSQASSHRSPQGEGTPVSAAPGRSQASSHRSPQGEGTPVNAHAVSRLRTARLAVSSKPYVARGSGLGRCPSCRLVASHCICALRPQVPTRAGVCLIMGDIEALKPSNTGWLIADVVADTWAFGWARTAVDPALLTLQ